jgi:hypothetical protein
VNKVSKTILALAVFSPIAYYFLVLVLEQEAMEPGEYPYALYWFYILAILFGACVSLLDLAPLVVRASFPNLNLLRLIS